MTKDELIDAFGVNNWKYEKDDPYRKKLLELSYGDLVDKLNHLKSQTAVVVFGGVNGR